MRALCALAVCILVLSACGSDGDDDGSGADSTATTPEEAQADESAESDPAPTSVPAAEGALVSGSVTSAADVTAAWNLVADDAGEVELCFDAALSHPDPAVEATLGVGVSECLQPEGGIAAMEESLSVSVGVVDGERTFGYLWGRVAPEVDTLTIEHLDGSQTEIDLTEGPGGLGVFAVVLDTTTIPPVDTLDAATGTTVEHSEPILNFLRSGPTYPTTAPTPPPSTTELYPTN